MLKKATIAGLMLMFVASVGLAQEKTNIWEWTEDKPHHASVVQVCARGRYSPHPMGSGAVVEKNMTKPRGGGFDGLVLTAYHVIDGYEYSSNLLVSYSDGHLTRARVMHIDQSHDIALLKVIVPKKINAVVVVSRLDSNSECEAVGYGGNAGLNKNLRHYKVGKLLTFPSSRGQNIFNAAPIPGDSGGPIFNDKYEVIGIISGGWRWYNGTGAIQTDGRSTKVTWPLRGSGAYYIHKLLRDKPAFRRTRTIYSTNTTILIE